MWRRLATIVIVLVVVATGLGWYLTAPKPLRAAELPAHEPDVANGELIFYAGGCSSCHAAEEAKGADRLKLGGGMALKTDFGTFHVPNISPDKETGIGSWSDLDFASALLRGVS